MIASWLWKTLRQRLFGEGCWNSDRGDILLYSLLRLYPIPGLSGSGGYLLSLLHSSGSQQGGTRSDPETTAASEKPYPGKRPGLSVSLQGLEGRSMPEQGNGKIKFDGTVSLGNIIILIGLVGSGVGIYTTTSVTLHSHALRITANEKAVNTQWERSNIHENTIYKIREDVSVMRAIVERELKK